jgi:hypothetical protein
MSDEIFPPYRSPDWVPLQRALSAVFGAAAADASAAFWFIGFVDGPVDVGELRLYEHSATRRRLALDRDGGAYRWLDGIGHYVRIPEEDALVETLA